MVLEKWRLPIAWLIFRAVLRQPRLKQVIFIGVTGSTGKTTTKDLSAAILGQVAGCSSSERSYNRAQAVARAVLRTASDDRYCVIEVSGSFRNAMAWTLRIFRPHIAVITIIKREHVTGSFDLEAITEEKSKLVKALRPGGTAVLNIDDPQLAQIRVPDDQTIVWFGRGEGATVRLLQASSTWPQPLCLSVAVAGKEFELETGLHGVHLVTPVLAALGVALAAGVDISVAAAAIKQVTAHEGRMQIITEPDGVTFIRDDWKAPAWSLLAPLQYLKDADAKRKIAIIGTISDYSRSATQQYRRAATEAREHADLVIFVGDHAHRALRARSHPEDRSIQAFSTLREAADYLQDELVAGDLVLLKGSCLPDHLQRLLLHRQQPIQCWDQKCGIPDFCDRCPRLYQTAPATVDRPDELPAALATNSDNNVVEDAAPAPISAESGAAPALSPGTRQLIVGLGNWGEQYHNTPHNLGHAMVDWLAATERATWEPCQVGVLTYIQPAWSNQPVALLKLETLINLSGPPINDLLRANNLSPADIIVLHDDLDVEIGKVRIKRDGGDAGHRGIRSIVESLETDVFTRIRIGVRRAGESTRAASGRVIQAVSSDDRQALEQVGAKVEAMLKQHHRAG